MSERFTVALSRLISAALGPNPLDSICPDMPAHDAGCYHIRLLRLAKVARGPAAIRRLSAA